MHEKLQPRNKHRVCFQSYDEAKGPTNSFRLTFTLTSSITSSTNIQQLTKNMTKTKNIKYGKQQRPSNVALKNKLNVNGISRNNNKFAAILSSANNSE
jgi:phosphotransferase system IIB component